MHDRLTVTFTNMRWLRLFGLAMLVIAGIDALGHWERILPPGRPEARIHVWFVLGPIGLAFIGVRQHGTLNKEQRTAQQVWGWLVPLHLRTTEIGKQPSVILEGLLDNKTPTQEVEFLVDLKDENGAAIRLDRVGRHPAARAMAESVAKFLDCPFEDKSRKGGGGRV